jgi:hypothetical protein
MLAGSKVERFEERGVHPRAVCNDLKIKGLQIGHLQALRNLGLKE